MSRETTSLPSAFERTVIDIYNGKIKPRNHQADEIHDQAVKTLTLRSVRSNLPSRERFWVSGSETLGKVGLTEVRYRLMTERKLMQQNKVRKQILRLVINNEWEMPAAVIVPPITASDSASVVVGDTINEPAHLVEVATLVNEIWDKSYPFHWNYD